MREGTAQKVSNALLSGAAGFASFIFSLAAMLYLTEFDAKVLAAVRAAHSRHGGGGSLYIILRRR